MPKSNAGRLDAVFAALSDPIRRGMVTALAQRETSVTVLSKPFSVSAPAISKHLRVLETAGLITRRKLGRVHFCRLRANALQEAGDWIEQQRAFWERQFDALANYLDKEDGPCNQQQPNNPESPSGSRGGSKSRARESSARGRIRKR